jgi:hypothetical protein
MSTKRIAYLMAAAILLGAGLACGEGATGEQCTEGRERTRRTGHGVVHEKCVKRPTDVTPQWHRTP